jgi:hypothetical protein
VNYLSVCSGIEAASVAEARLRNLMDAAVKQKPSGQLALGF